LTLVFSSLSAIAQQRPSVHYHIVGKTYNLNEIVSVGGVIYRANASGVTTTPPSVDWIDITGGFDLSGHDVVELDDVTDAGSGAIITVAERASIVTNNSKVTFPEAPNDGQEYARRSLGWTVVTGGGAGVAIATVPEINTGTDNTKAISPFGLAGSQIQADVTTNNSKISYTDAAAVSANTSKVTNATHTGEVTGSTALTIAANAVETSNILNGTIDILDLDAALQTTAGLADSALQSEVDGSITNEIQDLTLVGNTLAISSDPNTDVDLSGYLDNTDTQLSDAQVATAATNEGFVTGAHTTAEAGIITKSDYEALTGPQQLALPEGTSIVWPDAPVTATQGGVVYVSPTTTGSITLPGDEGNHLELTLTGDVTLNVFSTPQAYAVYTLEIKQDGAGLHTVTWVGFDHSGGIVSSMTLDPNAVDIYTIRYNGSAFQVLPAQNFLTVN